MKFYIVKVFYCDSQDCERTASEVFTNNKDARQFFNLQAKHFEQNKCKKITLEEIRVLDISRKKLVFRILSCCNNGFPAYNSSWVKAVIRIDTYPSDSVIYIFRNSEVSKANI